METRHGLPRAGVAALAVVGGFAIVLITPIGCLFRAQEPPSRNAEITGTITTVETQGSGVLALIEEQPGIEDAGDKMWVWVTDDTRVFIRQADSSWRRGAMQDLKVGLLVQAWPRGIVDTYPARGSGGDIAILGPEP